jgi:phage-related baseplate assembly protein
MTFLTESPIRPLTDHILLAPPDVVEYDLDLTYYIARSSRDNAETIQEAAEDAVNAFTIWQKTNIGTDLNTDVLTEFLRATGVKRAVIRSPQFTVINDTQIAVVRNTTILYGGIEDD